MKYIFLISLFITSSYAIKCDGYIDLADGLYNPECGAIMLNMTHNDYSFTMGLLGALTGLVFLSSIIYIIFNIGKTYKV